MLPLFPTLATSLWISVKMFTATLQTETADKAITEVVENQENKWTVMRHNYESIKNLSNSINHTIGSFSLCFLLETILVSSFFLYDKLMVNHETASLNWSHYAGIIMYEANLVLIVVVCADICVEVRTII